MGMIQSLSYTLYVLKKSFLVCWQKPALFLFPFLSFLIFVLIEALVWIVVYFRFGIHIFNADTLELWGLISLWELSFIILFLLAPLYFFIMINILVMQVSSSHYLLTNQAAAWSSMQFALRQIKTIIAYAWARTIVIIGGESPIKQFLKKRAHEFGINDFLLQAKSDMWTEVTMLMVPLIASHNITLKEMFKKSEQHMQETFGNDVYAKFVFNELFIIVTIIACFSMERLTSYLWNEAAGVAVIFFIMGLILTIVMMAEGVFFTVLYQYCFKVPMVVFTADDVKQGFEKL